eukprot:TRINITY_DN3009_c0_g2_i1.p1 TRINITY_DN3009_c0_g2~~TRINITY_DN3009_c0_g2_i1.p1  ORF type:complete len:326 (-),score=70.60 TRINITY_DN3009_c0_g2_i1:113-1090(-)
MARTKGRSNLKRGRNQIEKEEVKEEEKKVTIRSKEWTFPLPSDIVKEIFHAAGMEARCKMHLICLDLYHLSHNDQNFWRVGYSINTGIPLEILSHSDAWRNHCMERYHSEPYRKLHEYPKKAIKRSMKLKELEKAGKEVQRLMQTVILDKRFSSLDVEPDWLATNSRVGLRTGTFKEESYENDYDTDFNFEANWKLVSLTGKWIEFKASYSVRGDNSEEGETSDCYFNCENGDEGCLMDYDRPINGGATQNGDREGYETLVKAMTDSEEQRKLLTPFAIWKYVTGIIKLSKSQCRGWSYFGESRANSWPSFYFEGIPRAVFRNLR